MSFFKRLSSYIYGGSSSSTERILEYYGLFYHYSRGQWSCLFNECEIAIIKKPESKYSYYIQVTRVVEENNQVTTDQDQENEDDEDGEPNSYEFPITVGLDLYREDGPLNGHALSWRGTQTRFMFEFDHEDERSEECADKLQLLLCQCIYESKYQQHHSNAPIQDVECFCRLDKTETIGVIETNVKTIQPKQPLIPVQQTEQQPPSPQKPTSIYGENLKEEIAPAPKLNFDNIRSSSPTGEELFRSHCSLYLESNQEFHLQDSDVFVLMNKTRDDPLEFTFFITKNEKVVLSQVINSDMYPHFFNEQISFIWFSGYGNNYTRWSIRFDTEQLYESFRDKFTVLNYEALHQTKFKGKKDEVKFLAQGMTDDYNDPNIIFDTDDGFTQKDLEDFSELNISSSQEFTHQEQEQLKELESSMHEDEDEIRSCQSNDLDEEDEDEYESQPEEEEEESEEEEEEEEESEEEEEPGKFVKRPSHIVYEEEESEEEEEESEEEEEEESEEEEDESEEEDDKAQQKYISTRTPTKKPPVVVESEEESDDEETEEDESEEEDEIQTVKQEGSGAKNSELLVGYKDRSYVVRGSNIGVFNTGENDVQFNSIIKGITDKKGEIFSPKKLMLQNQDSSLLMLNPKANNKVFKMDLNRPDVVQEWDLNWNNQNTVANTILPQHKFDETTNTETFVGMNGNNLFLIDPRENKNKITQKFTGGSNPRSINTCGATSNQGHIAMGTNKGEIKLFTKTQFDTKKRSSTASDPLGKILRSRTTLPGIGDPIIGIDTTHDGKWVVATCKQYLLIVPVETKDGSNGFEDRLGERKPIPKRLQLKPNDLKRLGGKISFTPAKFNIAPGDQQETSIVTSSGNFLITWNFRKIKQNVLDIYQMQEFNTEIVADQFKFNRDNSIIVTLPNDVCMSKKVYKPTK